MWIVEHWVYSKKSAQRLRYDCVVASLEEQGSASGSWGSKNNPTRNTQAKLIIIVCQTRGMGGYRIPIPACYRRS
jgi:hypothetical protein